jgi:hypothetical protein
MFEKDCYHCVHIRPRKGNLCSVLLKKVSDIHTFCCDNFKVDIVIKHIEETMMLLDKKDDEGSSYGYGKLILSFV